jgi:hypothetical protein
LGNEKPPIIQTVETEIIKSLITLATRDDVNLVEEMRECMRRIPWESIDQLDESESSWFRRPLSAIEDDGARSGAPSLNIEEGTNLLSHPSPTQNASADTRPNDDDDEMGGVVPTSVAGKPSDAGTPQKDSADARPNDEDDEMSGVVPTSVAGKPSEAGTPQKASADARPNDEDDEMRGVVQTSVAGTPSEVGTTQKASADARPNDEDDQMGGVEGSQRPGGSEDTRVNDDEEMGDVDKTADTPKGSNDGREKEDEGLGDGEDEERNEDEEMRGGEESVTTQPPVRSRKPALKPPTRNSSQRDKRLRPQRPQTNVVGTPLSDKSLGKRKEPPIRHESTKTKPKAKKKSAEDQSAGNSIESPIDVDKLFVGFPPSFSHINFNTKHRKKKMLPLASRILLK